MLVEVFLRYYHADQLYATVLCVVNRVVVCQSCMRRFAARLRYRRAVETYQSYRLQFSSFALDVGNCSSVVVDAQRQHVVEDRDRAVTNWRKQQELIADELKKQQKKPSTPVSPPVSIHSGNSLASRNHEMASAGETTGKM